MLISELNMKCEKCPIVDYCNSYDETPHDETPPCEQARFERMKVEHFLSVVDYLENKGEWESE